MQDGKPLPAIESDALSKVFECCVPRGIILMKTADMKKLNACFVLLQFLPLFIFSQGSWIPKRDFPGTSRYGPAVFSIGQKGYVCMGWDGSRYPNDLWEYDEPSNSWTQKANFSGTERGALMGFRSEERRV